MVRKFEREYVFLSNFYPSPIESGGLVYPTAEHLYQALKCAHATDREMIRLVATPGKAKRRSRKVEIKSDWEEHKEEVMAAVVMLKFQQNPELARRLRDTADEELVEGNVWHDNFWGDCPCPDCESIPGRNRMGEILQQVRLALASSLSSWKPETECIPVSLRPARDNAEASVTMIDQRGLIVDQ